MRPGRGIHCPAHGIWLLFGMDLPTEVRMETNIPYVRARDLLLEYAAPGPDEEERLEKSLGRVLSADVCARFSVPPFDRSAYDGYAFRACDTAGAGRGSPVTLRVLEEVQAGVTPSHTVTEGTAVRIMTGAPIPEGADAVVMYEKTDFTDTAVTLYAPAAAGQNIVRAGEDVRRGEVLARAGDVTDPGTVGTLAAQGITAVRVFPRPRVAVISTGTELAEPGTDAGPGKIYDSNLYTFSALLQKLGCESVPMGPVPDSTGDIARLIERGLSECSAVLLTGGVSAGDFDLTPAAMEACGAKVLVRGVGIKPGMACCFAQAGGRLIFGLSGNPASGVTCFHAVAAPALRKMCGRRDHLYPEVTVTLRQGFKKASPVTRLLRGKLDLSGPDVGMVIPGRQGNAVLSTTVGNDVMAVIPGGSGPVEPGTKLKGFLI